MVDQALEFFAWGAKSWVCAASNFAARAHIALWDACVNQGDFTKGRAIMTAMLPLMTVLEQGGNSSNREIWCDAQGPCGKPRRRLAITR